MQYQAAEQSIQGTSAIPNFLPPQAYPCTCPEIRKSYWCLKYSWPISARTDRGLYFPSICFPFNPHACKWRPIWYMLGRKGGKKKKKSTRLSVHLTAELWECSWFAQEILGYLMMFWNVFTQIKCCASFKSCEVFIGARRFCSECLSNPPVPNRRAVQIMSHVGAVLINNSLNNNLC